MFIACRAITYVTSFSCLVLLYLPARVLAWSGIVRPAAIGWPQMLELIVGSAGAFVIIGCVSTFARIGRGTPAPFDPPRRLVMRGPYRFVRNPMYIGAGFALAGAACFYRSLFLVAYGGLSLLVAQLFVTLYEEPTPRRSFGPEYGAYCHRVRRWWPVMPVHQQNPGQ